MNHFGRKNFRKKMTKWRFFGTLGNLSSKCFLKLTYLIFLIFGISPETHTAFEKCAPETRPRTHTIHSLIETKKAAMCHGAKRLSTAFQVHADGSSQWLHHVSEAKTSSFIQNMCTVHEEVAGFLEA